VFVSGLLLAAGASSRFGSPKMLAPVPPEGRPMLAHVIDTWRAAGVAEIVVVLGKDAVGLRERFEAEFPRTGETEGIRFVENPDWESGMFSSVRCGLAALTESSSTHIAVSPADIPFLSSSSLRTILDATALPEADSRTLLVPVCGRRRGHPLVIPAALCPRLLSWPDTSRLNRIFGELDVKVLQLDGFDDSILLDVDTRADLVTGSPATNT
jgi:molybdenum cofactor cytidylyltransferase